MRDEEDQRRAAGWAKFAALAIVAIVVVVAIGYVVGSKAVPENNLYSSGRAASLPGLGDGNPADNGAIPTYAGGAVADQPAASGSAPAASAIPANTPSPVPDVMNGSVARDDEDDAPLDDNGEPVPPSDRDADRQGRREIADAIQDATIKALDRGRSARWNKDGLTGYAVAGVMISDGARVCRDAYATTVRDSGETRTPTARWCRADEDSDWERQ